MSKLGTIEIVLKSPDGLHNSIQEYMEQWPDKIKETINSDGSKWKYYDEDWEDEYLAIQDKVREKLKKFVEYSEYVKIVVNLDDETASVIPLK